MQLRSLLSASTAVAAANLVVALAFGLGVFLALPARWPWVDVPIGILVLVLLGSSVGLLSRWPFRFRLARIAAFVMLAIGLSGIFAIASAISFLRGVFGAIGSDGALMFVLV